MNMFIRTKSLGIEIFKIQFTLIENQLYKIYQYILLLYYINKKMPRCIATLDISTIEVG